MTPMVRGENSAAFNMVQAVDLFAGAGGWDVHCAELGIDVLGIEVDPRFNTVRADITALDPADYPCDLLIASPPCTAFSMAGKGRGRDSLTLWATAIQHMHAGAPLDRAWLDSQCDDPTAHLVLEPLRWALELQPDRIACEQVPPVLPLWQLMADVLRERGYSVWTGILECERYGVPQTRERAILMASGSSAVHPPRPTHQRYVYGQAAMHEFTLEGEILPWISMEQALDWDHHSDRPVGYRLARGEGMLERHGERRTVPAIEPAPAITSKARTATWEPVGFRNGNQANSCERGLDQPAPTIHFGHNANAVDWVVRTNNNSQKGGGVTERFERPISGAVTDRHQQHAALDPNAPGRSRQRDRRLQVRRPVARCDRPPEMATHRETMSSWFAVSIEQGRDAGLKLANDTTKLALIGPVLETAMKAIAVLVEERFGKEAHETATNIAIEVCMSAAKAAGFDVSYDPPETR